MKTLTLYVDTYYEAKKAAPWAAVIARVDGGYIAFETVRDYDEWRKQR